MGEEDPFAVHDLEERAPFTAHLSHLVEGIYEDIAPDPRPGEPSRALGGSLEKRQRRALEHREEIGVASRTCFAAGERSEETHLDDVGILGDQAPSPLGELPHHPIAVQREDPDLATAIALFDRTQG